MRMRRWIARIAACFLVYLVAVGAVSTAQTSAKPNPDSSSQAQNTPAKKKTDHPINPIDTGGPRLRGGATVEDLCSTSETAVTTALDALDHLSYAQDAQTGLFPSQRDIADAVAVLDAFARGRRAVIGYDDIRTRGTQGVAIFKQVAPAVVLVVVGNEKKDDFEIEGLGSGAIVDPRGYVITNWHVVAGHDVVAIFLKPAGGATAHKDLAFAGRVVALNATADLALVKIVSPPSSLSSLQFEDASRIEVAEDIHIIGHPEGKLWSYTTGVISQIRDSYQWTYADHSHHQAKVLQLQTAVNPGNSGGPVVDDQGKLIGLVAASTDAQNLNYAIAGDAVQAFVRGNVVRVRGTAADSAPQQQRAQSANWNSRSVLRIKTADAMAFTVLDSSDDVVAQVFRLPDGRTLQRCPSSGDTSLWRYWSRSGQMLEASGNASSPTVLSTPEGQ